MSKNRLLLTIKILIVLLVGCDLESAFKLGSGYYLFGEKPNTSIVKELSGHSGVYDEILVGTIIEYGYDDEFIIAKRNINDGAIIYFNDHPLWEKQLGNGDTIQYWIIDKRVDSLFGPFNLEEFSLKCTNLKINPDLKFDGRW